MCFLPIHFSLCGLLRPTAANWRFQDPQTRAKSPFYTFFHSCIYSSLHFFSLLLFSMAQNIIFLFAWTCLLSFPFLLYLRPPRQWVPTADLRPRLTHSALLLGHHSQTHVELRPNIHSYLYMPMLKSTHKTKSPLRKKRFVYVPRSCFIGVCVFLLLFFFF